MARAKMLYDGDINPEQGGHFYSLKDVLSGYACAVRIVPASDAGLADNEFWVERLTVNFPEDEIQEAQILQVVGTTLADFEKIRNTDEGYTMLIYACIAYGRYDQDASEFVRIGARDQYARKCMDDDKVNKRLQHNAHIGNYARKVAREYF